MEDGYIKNFNTTLVFFVYVGDFFSVVIKETGVPIIGFSKKCSIQQETFYHNRPTKIKYKHFKQKHIFNDILQEFMFYSNCLPICILSIVMPLLF